MMRVFVGYDPAEVVAYHVLAHSILARASEPVSVTPLKLSQLPELKRARDPLQSTEFAFSRFLVPWLCGYEGWALFLDCDMLALDDICKLRLLMDPAYAVRVVQHDHQPVGAEKFLGRKQTQYPCKNWSSVMLFNCAHEDCAKLTPELVSTHTGLYLHQFKWARGGAVDELPARWNHLVGWDEPTTDPPPAIVHYTEGGPWFHGYQNCDYSGEWFDTMISMIQRQGKNDE